MKGYEHLGTKKQLDETACYVAYLLTVLKLREWQVYVSSKPSGKHALAFVFTTPETCKTRLQLSRDWATMGPISKRHTLVHEMMHLAHVRLNRHLDYSGSDVVSEDEEYTVDRLADAIAPLLLPFGHPDAEGDGEARVFFEEIK